MWYYLTMRTKDMRKARAVYIAADYTGKVSFCLESKLIYASMFQDKAYAEKAAAVLKALCPEAVITVKQA